MKYAVATILGGLIGLVCTVTGLLLGGTAGGLIGMLIGCAVAFPCGMLIQMSIWKS